MIYLIFLVPFSLFCFYFLIDVLSFYLFNILIYSNRMIRYLNFQEKTVSFINLFGLIIAFHIFYSLLFENKENKYSNLNEFVLNLLESCLLLIIFKMEKDIFLKTVSLMFIIIFIKATTEYFMMFLKTK